MNHRCLATVLTLIAVVALTPVFAAAQSTSTTAPPSTPWGEPGPAGNLEFFWGHSYGATGRVSGKRNTE